MRLRKFVIFLTSAAALVAAPGCKDPRRGQSSAHELPVPDGRVVLLKRKGEMAAFILSNQRAIPEQMDYRWYYRSDGKGTFRAGDPAVSSGSISNAARIAFSTFAIPWSIHANGSGWVYYSAGPTEFGQPGDYLMCVTTETNLTAVDASGRGWNFRVRPKLNLRALIKSQTGL